MGEFFGGLLFFLGLVLLAGLSWGFIFIILACLLGLDDLDSLFFGPCALLEFFLQVHCFLFNLGSLLVVGGGVQTFAVFDEEGAIVDFLLVAVQLLSFLSFRLAFFLIVAFLLGLNTLLSQFLPLPLSILGLPFLSLLVLHLGGPGDPLDLLLFVLILLQLIGKIFFSLGYFLPEVVDLLLEVFLLLVESACGFVVFLLFGEGLHLLDELGQVFTDAFDLPVDLVASRAQLCLFDTKFLDFCFQLVAHSLCLCDLGSVVDLGGLRDWLTGGIGLDPANFSEQTVQFALLLLAQGTRAHLIFNPFAFGVQFAIGHFLQGLIGPLGGTGLSLQVSDQFHIILQFQSLILDLSRDACELSSVEIEIGIQDIDALPAQLHIFLDEGDPFIVGLVDGFDLFLLQPPGLFHFFDLLLDVVDLLIKCFLIGSMSRLFGQCGYLSLVIDVLAFELEAEAGAFFLLGAVLGLSAHGTQQLNNQSISSQINWYNGQGVIFFQMIRVHGLLRGKEGRKDWAGQTDAVLPKIGAGVYKWRGSGKVGLQTLYDKHSPKEGNKQSWKNMEGGHTSCITTLCSPSSGKHKMSNKENTSSSPSHASSKLQAKAFKFLLFEEELLRGAILKHLSGRQLSRQERIKLRTKAYFSFLRQESGRKEFDQDLAVIEIPEEERMGVSIQELVEGVRQAYFELGVGSKGRDVMMFSLHRRIAQIVGGLLAKGDRPIFDSNSSSSSDGQQLLRNYLKRYVQESERMNHCLSQSKSKDKLMGFYQQIYNRYESIPFSDTPEQSPSDHTIQPPNMLASSPSPSPTRGKTTPTSEQSSFIKLRFYNNLRKEVMTLSEDTEKIMQEESSKMGHS